MNRKLIVSILAIILAVAMILSVVLAALPSSYYVSTAVVNIPSDLCKAVFNLPAAL